MKIILDDTNPEDAEKMQLLVAVVAQQSRPTETARTLGNQEDAAEEPKGVEETTEVEIVESAEGDVGDDSDPTETDSEGVEWDAELHASTKTKTTNGQWKKRKGTAKTKTVSNTEIAKPSTGGPVSYEAYGEAINKHKGKFGVDRTREILKAVADVVQPSAVPPARWGEMVEALSNDKGPDTASIDLDDFC